MAWLRAFQIGQLCRKWPAVSSMDTTALWMLRLKNNTLLCILKPENDIALWFLKLEYITPLLCYVDQLFLIIFWLLHSFN